MILSAIIGHKQDEKEGGVSDINQAAVTICVAVQQMSSLTKTTIQDLATQLKNQDADRKAFYRTMGDAIDSVKQSQSAISETLTGLNSEFSDKKYLNIESLGLWLGWTAPLRSLRLGLGGV